MLGLEQSALLAGKSPRRPNRQRDRIYRASHEGLGRFPPFGIAGEAEPRWQMPQGLDEGAGRADLGKPGPEGLLEPGPGDPAEPREALRFEGPPPAPLADDEVEGAHPE